jgi:uncharacterized membrane protein
VPSADPSVEHFAVRRREQTRLILRWLLVAAFVLAAYFHIAHPAPFLRITPAWVPAPRAIIFLTGICELLGAVALLIPRLRWIGGFMLALYAICVFPANVQHALLFAEHATSWTGWLYHGPRLLFQPVIVWWCLFAGRVIDWPFTRTGRVGQSRSAPPRPHPRQGPTE